MQTILRRADVQKVTGLPRSTLYGLIAEGKFPKPVKITQKAVGWLEVEVEEWQRDVISRRDSTHSK